MNGFYLKKYVADAIVFTDDLNIVNNKHIYKI